MPSSWERMKSPRDQDRAYGALARLSISAPTIDLLTAWDAAEPDQRMRLVASIVDRIEAAADLDDDDGALRLIGVPREGWRSFFAYVVDPLHTRPWSNLSRRCAGASLT
jgi:hypothetical protein